MTHFEAVGLYYKKMVVVLPKCGGIRVRIAFISECLENTGVNFVRFFQYIAKRSVVKGGGGGFWKNRWGKGELFPVNMKSENSAWFQVNFTRVTRKGYYRYEHLLVF